MSGLLTLNSEKVNADSSPVAPGSIPSETPDQGPNLYEQFHTLSDVGELGFLFDHTPAEWVPTGIETSPESTITPGTVESMKSAQELTVTTHPQPTPGGQVIVAQHDPSGWSFADTLRNEVAGFQQRVRNLRANNGGQ